MDSKNIKQTAAYYLSCMKDDFSEEKEKEFNIWINESIEHKKAFDNLQKLHSLYKSISQDIKSDISKEVEEEIKREKSFKIFKRYALAASVLLCFSFGIFQTKKYLDFNIVHLYETKMLTKNLDLPDGSNVVLDAKTEVSIEYFEDKRKVKLQKGNAIFSVAKDRSRPFIIDTNKIRIEVLGTRFEVRNDNNTLEVSVIEGLVSIQTDTSSIKKELVKLSKGKKLVYDRKTNKYMLEEINIKSVALWKNEILTFEDISLEDAVSEFSRYKDIDVFLDDNIKNLTITGVFRIQDFDKFIYSIGKIHSLENRKSGKRLYIYKKM